VPSPTPAQAPPPLVVAASLAGLEGLALLIGAVLELVDMSSGHASLAISLAVFFAAYAALLFAAALALNRVHTWPRGPVLISQLILLGLAWGSRHEPLLAIGMAIVAVVTIVGVIHPASIEALEGARNRSSDQSSESND